MEKDEELFLLPHAEKTAIGRIVPEYAHARHLLIERTHVVHLSCPFFICKLSHSKFFHSPPTFVSTENIPAPAFPVQESALVRGARTRAYFELCKYSELIPLIRHSAWLKWPFLQEKEHCRKKRTKTLVGIIYSEYINSS